MDFEQIKKELFASGRVLDVLEQVARIPADYLDGKHHACPACGGKDRFRLVDRRVGAVLCNQCFSERNGDCIAAVGHFRGVDFPGALRLIKEFLDGVPSVSASGSASGSASSSGSSVSFEFEKGGVLHGGRPRLVKSVSKNGKEYRFFFRWNGYYYKPEADPSGGVKREIVFDWSNADGSPRHIVHRIEKGGEQGGKILYPLHFDAKAGRFLKGEGPLPRVPFNLGLLVEAKTAFLVEGEKCAVVLQKYLALSDMAPRCVATTTGSATSWKPSFSGCFRGKYVWVVPDNDAAGRGYAADVIRGLVGVAAAVEILDLWKGGSYPPKFDIADFLKDAEGVVL